MVTRLPVVGRFRLDLDRRFVRKGAALGAALLATSAMAGIETELLPTSDDSAEAIVNDERRDEPSLSEAFVEADETPAPEPETAATITNDDVIALVGAGFAESTILTAIAANTPQFDVSPRALLRLKSEGVPDGVIEAILASRATAVVPVASSGTPPPGVATLEPVGTPPAAPAEPPPAALVVALSPADRHTPRAWLESADERAPLAPVVAQVAFTDARPGSATLRNLQGFAGKALAFVNPMLSLGGIGDLLHTGEPKTAVWALAGAASVRVVAAPVIFELEYGDIPGIDPDDYEPALVELVPTKDNYRLVAAARTRSTPAGRMPSAPFLEEQRPAKVDRLGRGHYRVTPGTLGSGEYALVLRPVASGKEKRAADGTLGALLGTATNEILYTTWDFSTRSAAAP